MYRIYIDANMGNSDTGYWLGLPESKQDMDRIGSDLKEGLHVIIYEPNDFEMEAILTIDDDRSWKAIPVPETIKYIGTFGGTA